MWHYLNIKYESISQGNNTKIGCQMDLVFLA